MATVRIQVRRGTSTQWTSTNPILAAGEMGVETNTNLFKFGNGTATWTALSYANNSDVAIGEISQDAINAALTMGTGLTKTYNDGANTITIAIDDTVWANRAFVTSAVSALSNTVDTTYIPLDDRGAVNGVASLNAQGKVPTSETDLTVMATRAYAEYLQGQDLTALLAHESDSTNIHGIANTANLVTAATLATEKADAISQAATSRDTAISTALATEITNRNAAIASETTSRNAAIATETTNRNTAIAAEASSRTTGFADEATARATLTTSLQGYANGAVSAHEADTTNVHGIADTSVLATTTTVATAKSEAITAAASAAGTALTAHEADTTSVHGIADTSALALTATVNSALELKAPLASPTFTGTVSGITKTMVGLSNVDNTADSAKPVSTAAQTALDLKAPLASPTFTGTVTIPSGASISGFAPLASPTFTGVPTAPTAAAATNTTQVATTAYVRGEVAALVNSAGATLDTLGEIATALGNDANLSTTLTTSIATKAPIASPTFTGTVTIPAGASISGFAPLASPTFTGTNTVANITVSGTSNMSANGVQFSDGTQTKVGVPSITIIATALAAGAQTIAAGQQDKFIPLTGAVVITLPATGYSTGQSIDFYQESSTGAYFASTNSVVGTPGLKLRTTNSVATAMKTSAGWLVFGDLSA